MMPRRISAACELAQSAPKSVARNSFFIGSICDRLGLSQIGKEVANLGLGQAVEEAFRHEAAGGGVHGGDVNAAQADVRAVEAAENDDVRILIGEDAAQVAAV